ncbi:flagellar export chaperone FliS [Actinoplanes sp. M2I2]|uniref:flagellar export chaperone FliS n=1 Tax=Actinoplanes sp. M2I2 TaxID=1734444 RepID=UPI002021B31C|nr:flagellar export chaperone FliS [Actinoplanes sp. M2I2]
MTAPNLRNRYLQDSIETASPAKLLMMLYDRLVLDLVQGEEAIRAKQIENAHEKLSHAQEIVMELQVSLDVEAWSGAPGLANLYTYLITELIGANIAKDAERVAVCRGFVEPLRDAWREAAATAVAH